MRTLTENEMDHTNGGISIRIVKIIAHVVADAMDIESPLHNDPQAGPCHRDTTDHGG